MVWLDCFGIGLVSAGQRLRWALWLLPVVGLCLHACTAEETTLAARRQAFQTADQALQNGTRRVTLQLSLATGRSTHSVKSFIPTPLLQRLSRSI